MAVGDGDQADLAVLASGCHDFAIGSECEGVNAATRNGGGAELFDVFGQPVIEGLAASIDGLNDLFHFVRHGAVVFRGIDVHCPIAFVAGATGDGLAVGCEGDSEDAAFHRWELADEIGVVTDLPHGDAVHAVNLRNAIGTADENFVPLRVPCEGVDATFERARGDGGDVVDESLSAAFGEFDAHIATTGDDLLAVNAPECVEDPIVMTAHEQGFLAGRSIDGAQGIVCAAKSDLLAIWRPADSVKRVKGDGLGEFEFFLGDIPDLQFAESGRAATCDSHFGAIGRPGDFLNAL